MRRTSMRRTSMRRISMRRTSIRDLGGSVCFARGARRLEMFIALQTSSRKNIRSRADPDCPIRTAAPRLVRRSREASERFRSSRPSAPRSSWSTSTLGCDSPRGRRACSCTRGRTPDCWPRRRPCRRCGSCGNGTPCGKRCSGELEASDEGKRESGGRESFARRVAAPVRLGDLFVGSCLEDGRAGLFFLLGHACSRVRGSGAVRVRRACSEEPKTSSPGVFRSSRCRIEKRRQRRRRSRQIRWRKVDQPLAAHPFRGFDDRVRWLRRPTQTVTTS